MKHKFLIILLAITLGINFFNNLIPWLEASTTKMEEIGKIHVGGLIQKDYLNIINYLLMENLPDI